MNSAFESPPSSHPPPLPSLGTNTAMHSTVLSLDVTLTIQLRDSRRVEGGGGGEGGLQV